MRLGMGGDSCQFVGDGAGAQAKGGGNAKAMGGKAVADFIEQVSNPHGVNSTTCYNA